MVLSGTRYRCGGTAGSRRQNPSLSQDETHEPSRILLAQWAVMTTHHCARRMCDESFALSRIRLDPECQRVNLASCLGFDFSGRGELWLANRAGIPPWRFGPKAGFPALWAYAGRTAQSSD